MLNMKILEILQFCCVVVSAVIFAILVREIVSLADQNKDKATSIEKLQKELATCNVVSNNIDIGKIKGKGIANIEQLLRYQKNDTTSRFGYANCDTLGVVRWFCKKGFNQRKFYEKLANIANKDP